MRSKKHSIFAPASAGLASLAVACAHPAPVDEEVHKLIVLSRESNAALLRGDAEQYATMVKLAEDFTLMSPFGGNARLGIPTPERMHEIGKFFKNGSLEQEVVHTYSSPEMVVLAIIERAHVEVGGLPQQNWALRVTLVYRREGAEWRLAHRHADPLGNAISLTQAAELARGERGAGGHANRIE